MGYPFRALLLCRPERPGTRPIPVGSSFRYLAFMVLKPSLSGRVHLIGTLLISLATTGQDIRYFKDEHGWTPTEDGKGRYLEVTTMSGDSARVIEFKHAKSGRLLRTSAYVGDRPVGKWQVFDDSGKLTEERDFDILKYGSCEPKSSARSADDADSLDTRASFTGGDEAMYRFMATVAHYPDEAMDAGIQGTVYVRGKVDEQGDWQTVGICKGANPYLDLEAWRMVDRFPHWVPAMKGGRPVTSYYTLPVSFKLR